MILCFKKKFTLYIKFDVSFDNRLIKRSAVPAKTRTTSDLAQLEKQIRQQNAEYYEIYDLLEENLSKDDQIEILNANLQIIPDTQYQVSIFFKSYKSSSKPF